MADTHEVSSNIGTSSPMLKCVSVSKTDSEISLSFLIGYVCMRVYPLC